MKPLNYNNPLRRSQTKRVSRYVEESTIGTHVGRRDASAYRQQTRTPAKSQRFHAQAAAKRNRDLRQRERGVVQYVTPRATTRETVAQYQQRMHSKAKAGGDQQKRHSDLKRVFSVVAIVALLVAVGFGVGSFAFNHFVNSSMSFSDPRVSTMLTTPKENQPQYILLSADLTPLDGTVNGIDTMLLLRLDPTTQRISILQIPGNIELRFTDNEIHLADDVDGGGGDAEMLYGFRLAFDISLAHYARVSAEGIVALIDQMGGIEVNVGAEVDDPAAGDEYIGTGTQTLNGKQVLTYLRAQNYSNGLERRAINQGAFAALLATKIFQMNDATIASMLDTLSNYAKTDMSVATMTSLINTYRGISSGSILYGYMPGYELTHNGETTFIKYETSFSEVWSKFTSGEEPRVSEETSAPVAKGSFTITVRNGSGVDSGASKIASILQSDGYNVTETGNAEAYVYTETLVIYKDDTLASSAKNIVSLLGCGRTVKDVGFYVYSTDMLVVLGSDWHPEVY